MAKFDIKKNYSELSIRSKLLLGYSIVFFFFLLITSLVIYPIIRNDVRSNIEQTLQSSTQAILNTVKTAADVSIKNYLRAVAEKNLDIVSETYNMFQAGVMTEDEAKKRAASILLGQHVGKTGYIYSVNSKGIMQVHPVDKMMGADLTKFTLFNEQLKRKEGYLEYDWKNPGELKLRPKALYMTYFPPWDWIISASSYREEFSELVSVKNFRDSILSMKFGKNGYPFVLDSKGNVIIHPVLLGNLYEAQSSDGNYFVKEICARKNGRINYNWRNPGENKYRRKIAIFNYIPEFDWIVVSASYEEEVYEPLRHIQVFFICIFVVALIILFFMTAFFSSYIVNNLDKLILGFQSGSTGDFSIRMPKMSHDEFGRLAEGFNVFMAKLEAYNHSLQQEIVRRGNAEEALQHAFDELELRVAERTSQLAVSNQQLQQEVADRKSAEDALRLNERFLSGIFSSIQDGINVLDKDMKLLRMNAAMKKIYNSSASIGQKCFETYKGRKEPCMGCPAAKTLKSGKVDRGIFPKMSDDGQVEGWLELYSFPLVDQETGEINGVIEYAHDITERKKAEDALKEAYAELKNMQDQLLQSEKMATVGQLAAGVAHEINNPAGFVTSNLDILKQYIQVLNTAHLKYHDWELYLKEIGTETAMRLLYDMDEYQKTQGLALILDDLPALTEQSLDGMRRIQRIVSDLKNFSHSDEGQWEDSDLYEIIQAALNIAWNEIKYKADVVKEYADIPRVLCLPQQLSQVFLNLFVNAVQAIDERGQIRIRTMVEGDMVVIDVSDTGSGMTDEVKRHIFEPFFTTKPVGKGTGLGLSIAYNIIKKHHGEISVSSVLGQGTTFTIKLPKKV